MTNPLQMIYQAAFKVSQRRRKSAEIRFPFPTISVGGIAVGGSGKTPVVQMIAQHLESIQADPVILSRGYGRARRSGNAVWYVGERDLPTSALFGDEPAMLASHLSRGGLLVGTDRVGNVQSQLDRLLQLESPVLLLDDGFQHLQIVRDLDIVVHHPELETGGTLPTGRLRESKQGLHRADLLLIPNPSTETERDLYESEFSLNAFPLNQAVGKPRNSKGTEVDLTARKFFLVSGIARPGRFRISASELGLQVVGSATYSDHHTYTKRDAANLLSHVQSNHETLLLTTEKDFGKLSQFEELENYLYYLPYTVSVETACTKLITTALATPLRTTTNMRERT